MTSKYESSNSSVAIKFIFGLILLAKKWALTKSWIVSLLFFSTDGFDIKQPTNIDMLLNKETKSSLLFRYCPACIVYPNWLVCEMGSKWPYSYSFVGVLLNWSIQNVVYWPPARPNMPFQRQWKLHIPLASYGKRLRWRAWLTIWDKVKIPLCSHKLMHRKRVTRELHESYFCSMMIQHAIPKTVEVALRTPDWAVGEKTLE